MSAFVHTRETGWAWEQKRASLKRLMLENGGAWASFLNQHYGTAEHNSRAYDWWRHHGQLCALRFHTGCCEESDTSIEYLTVCCLCRYLCEKRDAL